jgi:lipoprotein-anchoring transpeptidase ErfK/SrfK
MRLCHVFVMFLAVASGWVMRPEAAQAQVTWHDGAPVFESDRRQQAEQDAAERAARRKTYEPTVYPKFMEGGEQPDIKPVEPPIVYFERAEDVGSIIVDTQARKLYYILPNKKAYGYTISVGRDGFTWTGTERISRIAAWPAWTPPPQMRERIQGLPITVSGGLKNPQGARALYLGSTIYRIHGTNNDRTVGRSNSSGCFRLTNENVVHLASIAKVGTKVRVMQSYDGGVSENAPLSSLFDFGGSDETPPAKPTKPKKKLVAKKPATDDKPASKAKTIAADEKPTSDEKKMASEVQTTEPATTPKEPAREPSATP